MSRSEWWATMMLCCVMAAMLAIAVQGITRLPAAAAEAEKQRIACEDSLGGLWIETKRGMVCVGKPLQAKP